MPSITFAFYGAAEPFEEAGGLSVRLDAVRTGALVKVNMSAFDGGVSD